MSTAKEANELKQQGAIEAAQDPHSSVTAADAQNKIVEESKNAGVAAFNFDPNASAEEKKRQARAAIPEGLNIPKRQKGVAIATDIDDGSKSAYDLPSPSKAGVVELHKGEDGKLIQDGQTTDDDDNQMGPKTGWAPRIGWPVEDTSTAESLLDHTTWLEGQLPDKFYGDWYQNSAVIIFACLASWLIAVLGGGLGWVFIIMAICSTYYRTSIRRVRRNFRDDVKRELSLKRLDTENESLEWINSFMVKFWPIYQPILAQTVINAVDQVLSGATPGFLDSLRLSSFTLGSKPPRMEHVKTYPKADDDVVMMDWKFSFTPNDTADLTSKQIKNRVQPKIVLEIRLGKAMISKGLDVIVEDMAFSGIMRLKIKLQTQFPHVDKIEMCFLERPSIDYVCKPLGGETFGFDINFIPGLESFIREQIHGNLAPMMYAPNVFPIEVAKMLSGNPINQAIGVIAVTIHSAQGLKNTDNFAGTADPYAVISLSRRQALARTKVIKDTANPRWNETHYIIATSFNDSLDIQIFDYNDIRKDKELGVASFQLENIEEINEYENEHLEVIHDGKARGMVSCDIRFFPVLEGAKIDGKPEPAPESNTGILRFTVEQAKELDGSKSMVGQLNPYAILLLNGKEVHQSQKKKRTNNPIWDDGSKEILITDRQKAKVGVVLKDDRDIAGDQTIGSYQIKLEDMLDLMEKGQDWYNLSGAKTGRVKMQAQWKPVAISGIIGGTGGYQTPIGVMRLHFIKATDLRNVEKMGKSDPYTRVLLSGVEKRRTVTFKNNLNPEWDEVLYVPVHSARERLVLEVMDHEKMGRDRSLGLVEIACREYISQDETGEYVVHDKKVLREGGLQLHGKGIVKGKLHYTVAFYPCLNVADPEDEEEVPQPEARASLEAARSADAGKFSSLDRKDTDTLHVPSEHEQPSLPTSPTTPKSPVTPISPTARKSRDDAKPPLVRLSPQELLRYDTGLIIFKLMDAELPRSDCHIEVFTDDMAFPSYKSSVARNRKYKFDEIGDVVVRELEWSELKIKVREKSDKHDEGDKDRTLATLTGNTLDTLKQCLNNPTTIKLKDDDGKITATVKISLKYIPIMMTLDPSESINNMGNLRVDVLDAENLPAADSNGKSDPYCKFELNGQDVFKSKTVKKTLNPSWNEFFEVLVPSRTAANFKATVWDYDFADKPDRLGAADINLEGLEPFKAQEMRLILDGKSGVLRLRFLFKPLYVTRTRQGTSTFSGTFSGPTRIVTGVAGAPIKGGVAVVGGVAHGVGKGASFIRRGFGGSRKEKDANGLATIGSSSELPMITTSNGDDPTPGGMLKRSTNLTDGEPASEVPPGRANGGTSKHNRNTSVGASSIHSLQPGAPGSGTASFIIVSASGYPPSADVYVMVNQLAPKHKTIGKTKHHKASDGGLVKFGETFRASCTPDTQFQIQVKEQHTFSSDDDLGEAPYFVDDSGAGSEKELRVGTGTVVLRSTFAAASEEGSRPKSSGAGLRRSFLSKREAPRSREGTPGGDDA